MKAKRHVLGLAAIVVFAGALAAQRPSDETANLPDESEVRPPVTDADLKIVQRAEQILNSPAKWNRADTRVCPSGAKTFSLYCALEEATNELTGNFLHRGAAMQQARFVIEEIAPNWSHYQHRLMDYNNDPTTTFADIQKMLALLEKHVAEHLIEESQNPESQRLTKTTVTNVAALLLKRVDVKHHGFDDTTFNESARSQLMAYEVRYVPVDSQYDQKNADQMKKALEDFWRARGLTVKVVSTLTPLPNNPGHATLEFDVYKQ